ncbi:MAG TPA: sulfite dehydrogenase [Gemmatimonadaceae bacterium]|nr:sulfite dehydrogenase [Gemmatimonadaceae bacterium]
MSDQHISRRAVLAGAAVTAGAALLKKLPSASAQEVVSSGIPVDSSSTPGAATSAQSVRSAFEQPARTPVGVLTGASSTPLQHLTGTVMPNDLLFERHHSGIPTIDPAHYKLLVHGLVHRPMVFTLADLKRFPSTSRVYFIECSGNGRGAYRDPKPEMTPQLVDGLTSNGEWTGVSLATVLREAGVRSGAEWLLAEGSDAAKLSRSIPIEKAWDDAMIVYAFNGEPLRPSNGYPARLFLPGWEANTSIKWLRRIEVTDQPNMSKDETSKYTDPLPNGTARQFSFVMDAKSIITAPAHPTRLAPGWHEVSGLAWSGRGRIVRVDVTTDGGRTWSQAELQSPVLPKAHTRFRLMWQWAGGAATLMSRATDESGYTQPARDVFEAARGRGTDYHFNHIRSWRVERDGQVVFGG